MFVFIFKEHPAFVFKTVEKKAKERHKRVQPSQSDSVLISYLDLNRPDIARKTGERTSNSASQSEPDKLDNEKTGNRRNFSPNNQASNIPNLATFVQGSLIIIDASLENLDPPNSRQHEPSKNLALTFVNGVNSYDVKKKSLGPVDLKKCRYSYVFAVHCKEPVVPTRQVPKASSQAKPSQTSQIEHSAKPPNQIGKSRFGLRKLACEIYI
jgi:hypothetical protein